MTSAAIDRRSRIVSRLLVALIVVAAIVASLWPHSSLLAPFYLGASSYFATQPVPRLAAGLVLIAALSGLGALHLGTDGARGAHAGLIAAGWMILLPAFAWEWLIAGSAGERSGIPYAEDWPRAAIGLFWALPALALAIDGSLGRVGGGDGRPRWWQRVPVASAIAWVALAASTASML